MHKLLTWLMLSLPLAAAPRALFYMTDRPESIRSFLEHASNIAIPASSPSGPNRLAAAGGGGADGTGSDLGLANPIASHPAVTPGPGVARPAPSGRIGNELVEHIEFDMNWVN